MTERPTSDSKSGGGDAEGDQSSAHDTWGDLTPPPVENQPARPEPLPRPPEPDSVAGSQATTITSAAPLETDRSGPVGGPFPRIEGYEVLQVLGRGGMGVVYKARDLRLNRVVALKMVLAAEHADPRALRRFMIEAEAAARLQHPDIVQIYDLRVSGGQPYYTMQYVEGTTLSPDSATAPRDARGVAALFERLARAVHEAHRQGIVHRDLKPANVLISRTGEPKITDFGLAKRLDEAQPITRTGAVMGTPAYMSPEQSAGRTRAIGPATDVYALGVMLYQMLTRRLPFEGATDLEVVQRSVTEEPKAFKRLGARAPRDLETICLKCLRKEPAERYATAGDLADDLGRFQRGDPIVARPIGPAARAVRYARRHRVRLAATAAAIVLAAIAAQAVWQRYAYVLPYTGDYADFANRWGVPAVLMGPLSGAQVATRARSYRITRRGRFGPVVRLQVIDGFGRPNWDHTLAPWLRDLGRGEAPHERATTFAYAFDDAGRLLQETGLNADDQVVWRCRYDNRNEAAGEDPRRIVRARFVDEAGNDDATVAGATSVQFVRNAAGQDVRVLYLDSAGRFKQSAGGVYGLAYEYDGHETPAVTRFLGPDGQPTVHPDGYAEVRRTFDEHDRTTDIRYFDAQGQPARDRANVHHQVLAYDEAGNLALVELLDAQGRPLPHRDGWVRRTFEYDAHGRLVRDVRSVPQPGDVTVRSYAPGPAGFARLVFDHDYRNPDHAKVTTVRWEDEAGQPVRHPEGFLHWIICYDARDRVHEERWTGYASDRWGFATRESTVGYDGDTPASMTVRYLDEADRPVRAPEGYLDEAWTLDANGKKRVGVFSGFEPASHGFASLRVQLDEAGRVLEASHLDAQGRPVPNVVVVVARVLEGRAAARVGLRAGDIVTQVNGQQPATWLAVTEPVGREGGSLQIQRNGGRYVVTLAPGPLGAVLHDRAASLSP
jgi:YD repeat-containing protein